MTGPRIARITFDPTGLSHVSAVSEMAEDQEPAVSLQQSIEDRERQIQEERQVLLTRVGSSDVSTLRQRVA